MTLSVGSPQLVLPTRTQAPGPTDVTAGEFDRELSRSTDDSPSHAEVTDDSPSQAEVRDDSAVSKAPVAADDQVQHAQQEEPDQHDGDSAGAVATQTPQSQTRDSSDDGQTRAAADTPTDVDVRSRSGHESSAGEHQSQGGQTTDGRTPATVALLAQAMPPVPGDQQTASDVGSVRPNAVGLHVLTAGLIESTPSNVAEPMVQTPLSQVDQSPSDANLARIARGLQSAISQNGGAVTLRLHPPELGAVRIEVEIHDGVVRAQFQAQNESVRALLMHQLQNLRQALQGHGLVVDRLDVQTEAQPQMSQDGSQSWNEDAADGRSRGQNSLWRRSMQPDPSGQDDLDASEWSFEQALLNTVG